MAYLFIAVMRRVLSLLDALCMAPKVDTLPCAVYTAGISAGAWTDRWCILAGRWSTRATLTCSAR